MKILVFNKDGSLLRYLLIDMPKEVVLAKGVCYAIGTEYSCLKYSKADGKSVIMDVDLYNEKIAVKEVLKALTDSKIGAVSCSSEFVAIGYHVVSEWEKHDSPMTISNEVIREIKEHIDSSPFHSLKNIEGVEACREILPHIPVVAVFDRGFYKSGDRCRQMKTLFHKTYKKIKVKEQKYYGISHKYVVKRASEMLNRPVENLNIVSCHLSIQSSICAIKNGNPVMLSMQPFPSREYGSDGKSGLICDNSRLSHNENTEKPLKNAAVFTAGELGESIENELAHDRKDGHSYIDLFDSYCSEIKRHIGGFTAVMGGLDAVILTGSYSEENINVRKNTLEGLGSLGVEINWDKNSVEGRELDLSGENSRVKVLVIPSNEELEIARDTFKEAFSFMKQV